MISYCIPCYRPTYAALLVEDLVRKTSVPYEILLWLNVDDPDLEHFFEGQRARGAPVEIVGRTPGNIGMGALPELFGRATFDMLVQIDDDVVRVSHRIAEKADEVFRKHENVGMITADVFQDEYTKGARPDMSEYTVFDDDLGLYDGPIDGWFAIYNRARIPALPLLPKKQYWFMGYEISQKLPTMNLRGVLSTQMKVFHVTGPQYASAFGMLDFEVAKYQSLGRDQIVKEYLEAEIPSRKDLARRVQQISSQLDSFA